MQKFINKQEKITSELLEGLALANQELLSVEQNRLVVNRGLARAERVAIVAIGAAGHEPALSGFVGEGMVDIAVVGDVFAAPGPQACVDAIRRADRGRGVLLIVLNHSGDMLTGNLAVKQAARLGIEVCKIVVQEDAALAPRTDAADRRGLVGCVPLCKIAGAAAAQGKTLAEVAAIAQCFADNMASIAVAVGGATNAADGRLLTAIEDGYMEIGVGIDGEQGKSEQLCSADEVAALLLDKLLTDLQLQTGERVLLIVNGSGATTLMEQLIVFRGCYNLLAAKGIEVAASAVGELLTVQDAAGLQLFAARMDDELLGYWNAPCRTPYYKN